MAAPPAVAAKGKLLRKGPWTEQEDLQLVWFVRLFGERRWDFLAKVSGLNRTGKSCRLRWVNYLHPGLKRGRMTPEEEQLVLQLHSKWGSRWSKIAQRIPGRTDNEIKNYWRTHMRKKAQERKMMSPSPLSHSSSSSSNISSCVNENPMEIGALENISTGLLDNRSSSEVSSFELFSQEEAGVKVYPMDQIWNEIAASETFCEFSFGEYNKDLACHVSCNSPIMSSPIWEGCSESLWRIDDEELKMLFAPMPDIMVTSHHHNGESFKKQAKIC